MTIRIECLEPEAALETAREAGVPPELAELNLFRVLLRRPAVAKGLADLLVSLLFRGDLDDRLRELVSAIGAWRLVSQLTRSLEIPLEVGVASWPPDGAKPPAAP